MNERRISTWQQDYAPPSERWAACWGDYDVDWNGNPPQSCSGPNEAAAIISLLENTDLPQPETSL